MRPFRLRAEPFRRTIADAKLQTMRFTLEHLELDVQWLVSRLGIKRSWGHSLKHPQAVNGVSTGSESFITGALPLVNRQLMTDSLFLDLVCPLNTNMAKHRLRPRNERERHGGGVLLGIDLGARDDLGARIASIMQAGEQQCLATIKIFFVDRLLRAERQGLQQRSGGGQGGGYGALDRHRCHQGTWPFIKNNYDADGLLLSVFLQLVHTHTRFEKTAIKVVFFEAQEVSIERWRVIGFPASPRGEQWALFRGHELAERAATEMGIALKGNLAHLWKNLCVLCLRYCRLARGTRSMQEDTSKHQDNSTALERLQVHRGSRRNLGLSSFSQSGLI